MRRKVIQVVAIAGGLLLTALATSPIVSAGAPAVKMVEVTERYAFAPQKQYVNVGGSVTWTNTTDAPHTVTSDVAGQFGSGTVTPGGTFSQVFSSAGSFTYHCTIHPYMMASILVLPAGATLPPTATEPGAGAADRGDSLPLGGLTALAALGAAGLLLVRLAARERATRIE